jgi:hypothetical protein
MANCVVDKVENLDEVTRINISLNTMVDAATKCLNIPLIPILDMQSIAEENQIILKLINVIRRTSSPTAFKVKKFNNLSLIFLERNSNNDTRN